jgi:hypothetical protein
MEGLSEGDEPERPEPGGKVLGPKHLPAHVPDPGALGEPVGLGDHVRVGVDPGRLGDERSQQQRQRTRAAAHVEQPPGPVEAELGGEQVREGLRIGEAAAGVVRRGAGVERRVPAPGHSSILPRAAVG